MKRWGTALARVALATMTIAIAHSSAPSPCLTAVASGQKYSLALRGDGTVIGWGGNGYGELGNGQSGPPGHSTVPVIASGVADVIAVAGGATTSLAIRQDGTVLAWGQNGHGQAGNGSIGGNQLIAQPVLGLTNVVDVAVGADHCLAIKGDGTVWAWGGNTYGQLGNSTTVDSAVPIQVPGLANVVALHAGALSSFALEGDGDLWSWGDNTFGQLGVGHWNSIDHPERVVGMGAVREVGGGWYHTLAVDTDGYLWSWGRNIDSELRGDGTTVDSNVPQVVPGFLDCRLGKGKAFRFSRVLAPDDTVWTWGAPWIILGNPGSNGSPQPVPGIPGITRMGGGAFHTWAIDSAGRMWAWGRNTSAQLGDGTTIDSGVPIEVSSLIPPSPPDPVPADQGNVVMATKQGADVLLQFPGAVATAWRAYRDSDRTRLGATALVPDVSTPSFIDPGIILGSPDVAHYRIKGLSPCGHRPGP